MLITAYMQLKHNYEKNYTLHNKDYPIISFEPDKNIITYINENREFDTIPMNRIYITQYTSLNDIVKSIQSLMEMNNGKVESNNTIATEQKSNESDNIEKHTRKHKKEIIS